MTLTEEEYRDLEDAYSGICTACGEIRHGETEPDAEGYHCEACGENTVVGMMNALLDGTIDIS